MCLEGVLIKRYIMLYASIIDSRAAEVILPFCFSFLARLMVDSICRSNPVNLMRITPLSLSLLRASI